MDASKRSLFCVFLGVRVLMALCSNSLHHGDESYQSVEVAHKLVFGTGYLTWEWTTPNPIRSYIHPLVFSVLFYILKILGLDSVDLIVLLPRLLHAIIAAISDMFILKFYSNTFGKKGRNWFISFYIFNYALLYFQSRTFINSLETSLGNIALYYYSTCIQRPNKANVRNKSKDSQSGNHRLDNSEKPNSDNEGSWTGKRLVGDENSNYAQSYYFTTYLNKLNQNLTHIRHRRGASESIHEINESEQCENNLNQEDDCHKTKSRKISASSTDEESKTKSRQISASSTDEESLPEITLMANNDINSMIYVAIIATSFVLRGTTAIFWLPLVLYHCKILYENGQIVNSLIHKMIPVAITVLVIATTIDSIFHGKVAFTHWNFFKLNLLVDVNTQCGVSNGVMTILYLVLQLNFSIVGFVIGLWKSMKDEKLCNIYSFAIFWTVYVFSNINHQEPRFILPLLPLSIGYAAYGASRDSIHLNHKSSVYIVYIVFNLLIMSMWQFFLQVGTENTTTFLGKELHSLSQKPLSAEMISSSTSLGTSANLSVLFMTYCHVTSFYSHVHTTVPMMLADCPLLDTPDWKSIEKRRRTEYWLNNDSGLLHRWPELYLYKHFRYPLNNTKIDRTDHWWAFGPTIGSRYWLRLFPTEEFNDNRGTLPDEWLSDSYDFEKDHSKIIAQLEEDSTNKVYGRDLPMPSHIVTLQYKEKNNFEKFLLDSNYEEIAQFQHTYGNILAYMSGERGSGLSFFIYRRKMPL